MVARSGECNTGEPLLRPVIIGGRLIEPLPPVQQARERAAGNLARLPEEMRALESGQPWPVQLSKDLAALVEQTRRKLQ